MAVPLLIKHLTRVPFDEMAFSSKPELAENQKPPLTVDPDRGTFNQPALLFQWIGLSDPVGGAVPYY